MILYFRCLCNQLQLIFNKELKMNRKKKDLVITLLNQVSTRNKGTATSGPRDAAAQGNSQQHLPGNSELLMEKQLKPKGRQDAPAGKTFHSLNFTNQRDGGNC